MIVMTYSHAHHYIPLSQSNGHIIHPNYNVRTNKIYLGLYTHTCYINGRQGVFVAGFTSSLHTPLKQYNDIIYVPSYQTVLDHNPAYQGGLRIGDEILVYNEKLVTNEKHLSLLISRTLIDTSVRIKFNRNGQIGEVSLFPEIKELGVSLHDYHIVYKKDCHFLQQVNSSIY